MDYLLLGRPLLGQQEYSPGEQRGDKQDWGRTGPGAGKMRVRHSIRYQTERQQGAQDSSQVVKQVP